MSFHVHLFDLYGRLRAAIVPTLRYAQDYYQRRLEDALASDVDWLDLGCGHRVLPEWRPDAERALVAKCRSVTGIDYDLPSLQQHRSFNRLVRGDIGALPFRDESFDLVTANMVVEHLANPAGQFAEIGRVLRPGGTLLLHTPNARGYRTILGRLVPEVLKRPLIWVLDTRPGARCFPHPLSGEHRRSIGQGRRGSRVGGQSRQHRGNRRAFRGDCAAGSARADSHQTAADKAVTSVQVEHHRDAHEAWVGRETTGAETAALADRQQRDQGPICDTGGYQRPAVPLTPTRMFPNTMKSFTPPATRICGDRIRSSTAAKTARCLLGSACILLRGPARHA